VRVTQELARVSEREGEVLAALGEHLSNAQIASRLHLSVRTVETHVSSLLRKLEVADRRALAALAPSLVGEAASEAGNVVRGLPAAWTPFIGRTHERADLIAALDGSRLVTMLGPGGAGKTRLASEVARQLAPTLPLGATFVELVSTRPGFFVQTVASVLGVTERPGQALRDAVLARLRPGRSLLVLDNCEHLLDDTADFVTTLLGETAELLVLTTSRERIGVPGERVVPLSGLSVVAESTGGAAGSEAVVLFFDRARTLDAQFDADPAIVGELCAQLDGMPLAIELATARSAALGIAGLRAGLTDRLRLLSGGRGSDDRHRSLRAVLDWSHELLDDEERAVLRRLGRFVGDVDIAAASAVTSLVPAAVTDVLGRLADKSLLVHGYGDERWSLLETVRAYALEKLTETGELEDVTDRYVRWSVEAAADLEDRLERGEPWRATFDDLADDLRAALSFVNGDVAAGLARSLGHLTFARRFLAESCGHYLRAADNAGDDIAAAHDLWSAAGVAQVEVKGELRHEYAVAAAQRAAAAGDHGTQVALLAEAVSVATRFPAIFERDVGLAELQQLLEVAHTAVPSGDLVAAAQLAAADAWTTSRVMDVPDVAAFDVALAAAEQVDDPMLISAALDALGSVQVMNGNFAITHELSARRLQLLSRLPGHDARAGAEVHDILHMAVETAITAGQLPFALNTAQRFGDDELVAAAPIMVESKPVVALVLQGQFDEAIARGERVLKAWADAGRPAARWLGPSMYSLVLCHALRGDDAAAAEMRKFAGEVAGEQTRNVHFQVSGMATFVEARLALHFGRWSEAAPLIADLPTGKDAWWQVRHWYFDAYPWAVAADLAVAAGLADASARLEAAEPAAQENLWARACVARARARRTADPADLTSAVVAWEQLGARYERACTLALIAPRRDEARAELDDLGVAMPHD
jgi:predicted ATPase/DNA-binding CsgD family transcriptional regulator